jgi:hypothetical protein
MREAAASSRWGPLQQACDGSLDFRRNRVTRVEAGGRAAKNGPAGSQVLKRGFRFWDYLGARPAVPACQATPPL